MIRKKMGRLLAVPALMFLVFIFLSNINVNAATVSKEDKIESIFDDMSCYYTQNQMDDNGKSTMQSIKKQNEWNKELQKMGVTKITSKEAMKITNNKSIASLRNVSFYTYNETYTYRNKKYSIRKLYAASTGPGNKLDNGGDGRKLYTGQEYTVKNIKYIASIYAQKTIGLIPVVQWLPYELLFSDNSNVTNQSHTITYRSTQTFCYIYVRPYMASQDKEELCFTSNKVCVSYSQVLAGYKTVTKKVNNKKRTYHVPYTVSKDTQSKIIKAKNYSSTQAAVKRYLDGRQPWLSYVEDYSFRGPNKGSSTKKITQKLSLFDNPNLIR